VRDTKAVLFQASSGCPDGAHTHPVVKLPWVA
jgi:hypothetical protein